MAKYLNPEQVKSRLQSKVKFAEPGDEDPGKMSSQLFNSLVSEAESDLEIDLMMRYEIPFQPVAGGVFSTLPVTTRTFITTLAELLSVVRILETDFGRGTAANGDKYTDKLQKRYDAMMKKLVEIKASTYQTWLRPPLEGLKLAYSNQGDTGFRGRVHNTSQLSHHADYAAQQINAPGETIWNSHLDHLDIGHGR